MTLAPEQCKAARSLLGWSAMTLSFKCPVSETTIRNFEKGKAKLTPFKALAIRRALEAAGIEFDDKSKDVKMREGRGNAETI
jgi:ribosome-binding protein aMBF1 (putative translation factor)